MPTPLVELDAVSFRTWFRQLALDTTDRLVLIFFAGLLAVVTALCFAGLTQLWVPQLLIDLVRP